MRVAFVFDVEIFTYCTQPGFQHKQAEQLGSNVYFLLIIHSSSSKYSVIFHMFCTGRHQSWKNVNGIVIHFPFIAYTYTLADQAEIILQFNLLSDTVVQGRGITV